jgi:hypothetical protein
MPPIQFGWSMTAGPLDKTPHGMYMSSLQERLDLVAGHFDSA